MPSVIATIAADMRKRAAAAEKKKLSNAWKLAKKIDSMGKEFTIGSDFSVTSIAPSDKPKLDKPNEWDEVLKK
jgi:hypothetical protein